MAVRYYSRPARTRLFSISDRLGSVHRPDQLTARNRLRNRYTDIPWISGLLEPTNLSPEAIFYYMVARLLQGIL